VAAQTVSERWYSPQGDNDGYNLLRAWHFK
jgi:hypothetical protein